MSKSRGSIWEDNEVFVLINIWAGYKLQQQLNTCIRKKPIWEKIARRVEEGGCQDCDALLLGNLGMRV